MYCYDGEVKGGDNVITDKGRKTKTLMLVWTADTMRELARVSKLG